MQSLLTICVTLVAAMMITQSALAITGEEVLAKLDEKEFSAKDSVAKVKMLLVDKDGKTSERKLLMYQKGVEQRLIRFLDPADVKGISFLDEGQDKMYVYLPAFHKIRRIAGHVKNENFAGTDFSHEDLSSDKFSVRLKVKGMVEEPEYYVVEAKPDSTQYSTLKIWVRKSEFLFDKVEYFDSTGSLSKVFVRKDFRPVGKYTQSFWAEIKDIKKNHATQMIVESVECDTGLQEKFFSKRQLKRQ